MEHSVVAGGGDTCRLIACPRPFSVDRIDKKVHAGATIAELLGGIGLDPDRIFARVFIDDRLIPSAEWQSTKPSAGQTLTVRVVPTGGQGGGKDALRIVAMIAVVALAVYTAGTSLPGSLAAFTGLSPAVSQAIVLSSIAIVGQLAITALIPPAPRQLVHHTGDCHAE